MLVNNKYLLINMHGMNGHVGYQHILF